MSAGTVPATPAHQGTLGFIERPLQFGDLVSFYSDDNGYRTGTCLRVITRGDDKGKCRIRSTCELRGGLFNVVAPRNMIRTLPR